tara:strand:+ start:508 stop:849 length:342 start_codon:yes stop_codon:yes gene_type:complete
MIKLKKLLNERKFGEPLPTLKSEMEKHQSKKQNISEADRATLSKMKQRMKEAEGQYMNWHINANEFLWDVDTSTGDGKKLKKMIYNNRFRGRDSGKEIFDLMEDIFKEKQREN